MTDKVADALALATEHNTLLQNIYIKGNYLKATGMIKIAQSLSWISNLSILDISNNQITEEAADAISFALLSNVNIKELYLSDNNLGSGIAKIAAALTVVSTLTVLNLNNNKATEKAADQLAAVVCNNKLEKLLLAGNDLKLGVIKIAFALSRITTLIELNLNNNNMTEEVACSIAAAIESNQSLTTVLLSNNKLQTKGMKTISQSLRNLSSLQVLHMDNNQINKEAANDIVSVISNNSCLRELYLDQNNLQDGIIEIANALKNTCALQKLILSDNNMSENVATALADALKNMNSLKVFAAMNNKLRTKGITAIAKSLSCISGLTFLNIHNNQITVHAEDAIASMIENNNQIQELYLSENYFTETRKIVASLKDAYALKVININNCRMSKSVAKDLQIALANKYLLNKVLLEGNYLKTDGIITVSKSLSCISNITMLNLYSNQLTEEAGEAVASIIMNNTKLEELYLGDNKLHTGALKVIAALKHISTLKVLDLNDNNITEIVTDELANAITCNPLLRDLRLRSNRLKTIKISKSLAKISSLKSLNLRNNEITKEASEAIASVLLSNTNMENLYFGCNYLKEGIIKMITALKKNSTLKVLDLDDNYITEKTHHELFCAFQSSAIENLWVAKNNLRLIDNIFVKNLHINKNLIEVDFNDNNLSGSVAQEFVTKIISSNNSLKNVLLQNNCFKTQDMSRILQSLSKLSTLKTLNIKGNLIIPELADVIALVIRNNTELEKLHLNCNCLQQDVLKVTGALKHNLKLKKLEFCGGNAPEKLAYDLANIIKSNHIEELRLIDNNLKQSAGVIIQAMSHTTSLTVINLSGNFISGEVANDLAIAITNNQLLKELRLVNNCFKLNGTSIVLQALSTLSNLKLLNIRRNCIKSSQELIDAIAKTVSGNVGLDILCLGDNNFSNHDISITLALKNTSSLVLLYLNNMQLTSDATNGLVDIIKTNQLLEGLYLGNNFLFNGLIPITKACKEYSKNLQYLDLQNNSVNSTDVNDLIINIAEINSLKTVFLSGLTLNFNEMIYYHLLAKHYHFNFSMCSQSEILDFLTLEVQKYDISTEIKYSVNRTYIPTHYVQCANVNILDMLQTPIDKYFLTNLSKRQQKLTEVDAKNVVFSLTILRHLNVIDLELFNIDENAAFELAAAIHYNSNLKQLWLRGNALKAAGALFILNSLEHVSTLEALDLSNNNIGYQIADSIAAVINKNHTLEELWLDGNDLLSKGIVRIASALKSLSTLRTLSLCNNGITDEAADELSSIIANNTCLEDLQLNSNHFQSAGISVIIESCNKLVKLRKLDLFNNKISKNVADKLASTISNCYNLQELYLSNNMLETIGAIKILQALKPKCNLQILTLNNNNISKEVVNHLTDVLINNSKFYILLIGGNNLQTKATLKIANVVRNHNTSMQLLAICDNNVSAQGKDEINSIFSTATQLRLYV